MRFGFIPTEGGRLFEQSWREVCYAEELRFDSVWLEEHHGVENHFLPLSAEERGMTRQALARAGQLEAAQT